MHPFLFDWVVNGHHFRPPSYGVMLAISFSIGYFLSLRRSLILGFNPKHIENLFLLCIFGSILGGRAFHVIFEEGRYYLENPMKIFAVWEGGYTFYGSVIGSIAVMFLYSKWKKLSMLQILDICTEATAFGLFTGRIGCFLAGCCWGKPTTLPWGVIFSHPDSFANSHTEALHPTQLYEAFGGLVIFMYLLFRFKRRKYEGQIFFHGIALYSLVRFFVEMFRGDDYRGFVLGGTLSYSQFVALVLLPIALVGMFTFDQSKKTPQP